MDIIKNANTYSQLVDKTVDSYPGCGFFIHIINILYYNFLLKILYTANLLSTIIQKNLWTIFILGGLSWDS